ncbi:MAG: hypothetical protein ACOX04_00245 [Candidatus Scatomorpha sp.]|jgi:hypothetical protein
MGSFLISEAGVFSIDKILEKLCSSIKDRKERAQLIEKLKDEFARYFKERYEHLSRPEEFDIYSLQEYLLKNLYTSVSLCFTADTSAKRSFFKDCLIETSYNIAGAYTKAKKQLVFAYVDSLLEIIKNDFLSKFKAEDLFLVNQQTEEIISALESYTKNNREKLETYIKYRGSFAEYIDSIKPLSTSKIYLHYLNPEIGFVRRDVQFKLLDGFLNDSASLLSLAVTGYGGIGKSRLMYEYIRDLRYNLEWKAVMLDRSQVDKLHGNFIEWYYPKNLLVVIDYAAEKPKEIGEWIRAILQSKSRPPKMRIVMLERQGLTEINKQIRRPHWYQQISEASGKLLSDIQYQHGNGFYELPRFNKEEMLRVMDRLPGGESEELTLDEKESIYNKILGFSKEYKDERFNTPLIALLLTDAYIHECDKDIENLQRLNPQHLMSYVTKRNRDSWERAFTGFENKEGLVNSLERLMVYATATGDCDLTNPPLSLFDDAQLLFDRMQSDEVEHLIALSARDDQQYLQLEPLKPDIIGEYFVLNYINKHRHSNKCKTMVAVCWEKTDEFLFFLGRCTRSYLGDFTHLIFGEQAILFHGADALAQAEILLGMTATPNIKHCQTAVEHIENLYQKHRESLFAELFAWGLFNLSAEQDKLQALQKTADKLKTVYDKWPGNQKVALACAYGLVNLSAKQDEPQALQTIDKIKNICDKWPDNQEIALEYAESLVNLYAKQDEPQARKTGDKIKTIYDMWPDNQEIASTYTYFLENISNKHD